MPAQQKCLCRHRSFPPENALMNNASLSYEELLLKAEQLEDENVRLRQNEARLESLLKMSLLAEATEEKIRSFALESVVALTESTGGYLHFVNNDNRTIDLVCWSKAVHKVCKAEKSEHYPLDEAGIWADSIRLGRPVVHNDYQSESGKKSLPEGHFPVVRHLGVPIYDGKKIVAVAGVGNKLEPYTLEDIRQTMLFMNNMWMILKRKKAEEILKRYSMEDGLTGLANRRRFDEVLEIEWRRALRGGQPLSLIMLDIDHFKNFNDTYGHLSGDNCLVMIGDCFIHQIRRAGDLVARYGGEEFAVILPGLSLEQAREVAESIRRAVAEMKIPHSSSPVSPWVTISGGVTSIIPHQGSSASELVRQADNELYRAKTAGRNRVSAPA